MLRISVALVALAASAISVQAAPTCVIVFANDRGHNEIKWHEMAHCWGWSHPKTPLSRNFMAARRTYDPPAHIRGRPYRPRIERPVSSKEAVKICGGHIGCMWFE